MYKLLVLSVILAVVSANSVPRHRYQINEEILTQGLRDREGRIVGGVDRTIEDHPYQIGLFFNRFQTCGGSVLSVNTILSAAHCTSGRNHANFQVLAGHTNINSVQYLITADRVTQHPLYDDWNLLYDIVILRLGESLTFGPSIKPTVLAEDGYVVADEAPCYVTGWGALSRGGPAPAILQGVDVPAWTNERCIKIYPDEMVLDQHFCAGAFGHDACQGDSGGPVTHNGIQVGVVSWGYSCADIWPTVYARVSYFRQFIIEEMNRG